MKALLWMGDESTQPQEKDEIMKSWIPKAPIGGEITFNRGKSTENRIAK